MAYIVLLPLLFFSFVLAAIALDRVRIIMWKLLFGFIQIQHPIAEIQSCREEVKSNQGGSA